MQAVAILIVLLLVQDCILCPPPSPILYSLVDLLWKKELILSAQLSICGRHDKGRRECCSQDGGGQKPSGPPCLVLKATGRKITRALMWNGSVAPSGSSSQRGPEKQEGEAPGPAHPPSAVGCSGSPRQETELAWMCPDSRRFPAAPQPATKGVGQVNHTRHLKTHTETLTLTYVQ